MASESDTFRCQMPVACQPRERCSQQCESCKTWDFWASLGGGYMPTLKYVNAKVESYGPRCAGGGCGD